MRDSHTISRFKGLNKLDSPMLIKPSYALDCRNVLGNPDGQLWVSRDTSVLLDFTNPEYAAEDIARITAIGVLDDQNTSSNPRLAIQQAAVLIVADGPTYANPQLCTGIELPIAPGRLSFVQSNSVLYFSSGKAGGKLLPGDTQVYNWGIVQPPVPPNVLPPVAGPLTILIGYQYRVCFGFSKTGHWSTASVVSASTGPLTAESSVVTTPIPTDAQVDQIALFRNLDGGGDWYLLQDSIVNLLAGPYPSNITVAGKVVTYTDVTDDDTLEDSLQTPPYDNGVSPNGKYLCPSLDRILMCGILTDPTAVAYSGYDSINFGRPQESWPVFNKLAIGEGQTIPNGIGLTRYGYVIFTDNRDMYIVRGTLQDVTVSAVQTPSFRVDQLPFRIGCYSHYTIQSTPSGLVFLSDALKLMLFDGYYEPQALVPLISGLLATITPGLQDVLASAYYESLERKLYILALPVAGSQQNNMTILLDVDADQERNTGAWVTDQSIDDIVTVLNQDGSRHVICAQSQLMSPNVPLNAGYISDLLLHYSEVDDPTTLMANAHWQSGYFGIRDEDGIDEWAYIKLFRFLRWVSELPNITVLARLVDGDQYTFDNPLIVRMENYNGVQAINAKCRACSLDLIFGQNVAAAPISAITQAWNFCGKR